MARENNFDMVVIRQVGFSKKPTESIIHTYENVNAQDRESITSTRESLAETVLAMFSTSPYDAFMSVFEDSMSVLMREYPSIYHHVTNELLHKTLTPKDVVSVVDDASDYTTLDYHSKTVSTCDGCAARIVERYVSPTTRKLAAVKIHFAIVGTKSAVEDDIIVRVDRFGAIRVRSYSLTALYKLCDKVVSHACNLAAAELARDCSEPTTFHKYALNLRKVSEGEAVISSK